MDAKNHTSRSSTLVQLNNSTPPAMASISRTDEAPPEFRRLFASLLSRELVLQFIVPWMDRHTMHNCLQVCRQLRDILMSRCAQPLWEAALAKDHMPACPDGLIEPFYMSVLYLPYCSFCGINAAPKLDLFLLRRFCKSCRPKMLVNFGTIRSIEMKAILFSSIRSGIHQKRVADGLYVLKQDLEEGLRLLSYRHSGSPAEQKQWDKWEQQQNSKREHRELLTAFMSTESKRQEHLCLDAPIPPAPVSLVGTSTPTKITLNSVSVERSPAPTPSRPAHLPSRPRSETKPQARPRSQTKLKASASLVAPQEDEPIPLGRAPVMRASTNILCSWDRWGKSPIPSGSVEPGTYVFMRDLELDRASARLGKSKLPGVKRLAPAWLCRT